MAIRAAAYVLVAIVVIYAMARIIETMKRYPWGPLVSIPMLLIGYLGLTWLGVSVFGG